MIPDSPLSAFSPHLFSQRRVLVAGGTSGIGAAIAAAFAAHGASVVATGATTGDIEEAELIGITAGVELRVLDVRDDVAVQELVKAQPELNVLVNCAGVIRRGQEHDPSVFAEVINVNLNGTMRMCAAARPALKTSGGCIINTASMLSFFGGGLVPAYSASKGGVAQLTKSLAIAYAADGIRVNALAPGYIATRLTGVLQHDQDRSDSIVGRTPMGRWGSPEDVAGVALFLASSSASFVTGAVLPVDGGYLVA